jgi:hypothetical protein
MLDILLYFQDFNSINPEPVNPLPSPSNEPLNEPEFSPIAKSAIEAVVALSAWEAVVAKLILKQFQLYVKQ